MLLVDLHIPVTTAVVGVLLRRGRVHKALARMRADTTSTTILVVMVLVRINRSLDFLLAASAFGAKAKAKTTSTRQQNQDCHGNKNLRVAAVTAVILATDRDAVNALETDLETKLGLGGSLLQYTLNGRVGIYRNFIVVNLLLLLSRPRIGARRRRVAGVTTVGAELGMREAFPKAKMATPSTRRSPGLMSVKNFDWSCVLTLQIPLSRQTLSVKGSATALVMVSESVAVPSG
jgi:hypothetical protein